MFVLGVCFFYTWCAMGLFCLRLHEWSYHPFMEPFNTWRGSSDVIIIYNGQYMHSTPLTRSLFYHVCSILLRIFFLTPCLMLTLYEIFPAVRLVFFKCYIYEKFCGWWLKFLFRVIRYKLRIAGLLQRYQILLLSFYVCYVWKGRRFFFCWICIFFFNSISTFLYEKEFHFKSLRTVNV